MVRVALLFALGILLPAFAFGEPLSPEETVGRMAQDALAVVKTDRKLAEKKVLEHIDFDAATRHAVGRAWSQASAVQKEQLAREFQSLLLRTYANASAMLQGDSLKVLPARGKAQEDATTVRTQFLRAGGQPLPIEFHVHRTAAGWKIYDIAVEGISLGLAYRAEFDAAVRQAGIDGLIQRLGAKNRD